MQGLRTKCLDIYRNIIACEYDIIILTETWLCDSILDSELCDASYDIFRSDRNLTLTNKKTGGGSLILVKSALNAAVRPEWLVDSLELVWISIPKHSLKNANGNLHVASVYIPGESNSNHQPQDIDTFIDSCTKAFSTSLEDNFLIVGDFNLPCIKWSDNLPSFVKKGSTKTQEAAVTLCDGLSSLGLV